MQTQDSQSRNYTPYVFTAERKEKLYEDIAHTVIGALFEGYISAKQARESAHFILNTLDSIETEKEMLQFLHDLAQKWSIYNGVYLKYIVGIDDSEIYVLEQLLHKLADIFETKDALTHSADYDFYIHQKENWYLRIGTRFFEHGSAGLKEKLSELLSF
jgi:hypothetical protein